LGEDMVGAVYHRKAKPPIALLEGRRQVYDAISYGGGI
jgi:hypothetical protein